MSVAIVIEVHSCRTLFLLEKGIFRVIFVLMVLSAHLIYHCNVLSMMIVCGHHTHSERVVHQTVVHQIRPT